MPVKTVYWFVLQGLVCDVPDSLSIISKQYAGLQLIHWSRIRKGGSIVAKS